jgi:hypothetical protein
VGSHTVGWTLKDESNPSSCDQVGLHKEPDFTCVETYIGFISQLVPVVLNTASYVPDTDTHTLYVQLT